MPDLSSVSKDLQTAVAQVAAAKQALLDLQAKVAQAESIHADAVSKAHDLHMQFVAIIGEVLPSVNTAPKKLHV